MVKLKNAGPKEFIREIQDKKLYFFGAGRVLTNCVELYCENKPLEAIVDNNEGLWGTRKTVGGQSIRVIGLDAFIKELEGAPLERVVLLITSAFYGVEIVEQLDAIPELEGLPCYLHAVIRNTAEPGPQFSFSTGEQKIPKKIHYIWIGNQQLPHRLQTCVDSWSRVNPDYEIIRWDESNYDFTKVDYMREAYERRDWAFASNYARLDVIYQCGGIYLDTDAEAVRSLDVLLCDEVFFGMSGGDSIASGAGFGAVPGHPLIKDLRDIYHGKQFISKDGKLNRGPGYNSRHPIFKQYGFRILNEYQKRDGIVLYPAEVLSPLGVGGLGNFFSEKTVSIHHNDGAGASDRERDGTQKLKELAGVRLGHKF